MKIKAGKCWEFPIKVISKAKVVDEGVECELVTANINNGAIFVFQRLGKTILRAWYDAYQGPPVKDWSYVYIWNSKELNTKGNPKMGFTIKKSDLEELL